MEGIAAPGARVLIRDEEWLVRRVDPSSDGGDLLVCDGVSDLVRGRTAHFLTQLEDRIEILHPAQTRLVQDDSSHFNASMLYIEGVLRRNLPNDEQIRLGHRAVMNLVPYQLDPALQALRQPRQRILIADATGLGKTLEAGILTTELIQRGRGNRILVITLKSMLTQFQKEFWSRFSIPLVRLDSAGLSAVRNRIPANHNPFNHYDRAIISIDTLKNNLEYRNYLENAWWDIIIIDECHNVAARANEGGLSRRARLARLLATRSDALILLSATPHDGSARSFASLMSLLDPTAISDPDDYTPEDFRDKGLVIRRFKKDIRSQVEGDFRDPRTELIRARATPAEDTAFHALLDIPFTQGGKRQSGLQHELQRVGMQKGLFSSPSAALQSTRNRIDNLQRKPAPTEDEQQEIQALRLIRAMVAPGQNDLFFVGDGHQRIYSKNKAVLGRCGIDIRGRSRKLYLNYRTTDEIRRLAVALLEGREVDDLDGGSDDNRRYKSLSHGPEPEVISVASYSDAVQVAVDRVVDWTQAKDGETPPTICVMAATKTVRDEVVRALQGKSVPTRTIEPDSADSADSSEVRVSTMHRAKGLEFDRVIVLSCGHFNNADDRAHLTYVSLTRAKTFAVYIASA